MAAFSRYLTITQAKTLTHKSSTCSQVENVEPSLVRLIELLRLSYIIIQKTNLILFYKFESCAKSRSILLTSSFISYLFVERIILFSSQETEGILILSLIPLSLIASFFDVE